MSVEHGQKPPQALETLHRIFTVVMWAGLAFIVGGAVGIFTLPSGPAGAAAFAIGGGIVMSYSGHRARKRYRKIVEARGWD